MSALDDPSEWLNGLDRLWMPRPTTQIWVSTKDYTKSMIGKNWQLVTYEPVEFEK